MDFIQDEKTDFFLQTIHRGFQFSLHDSVFFTLNKLHIENSKM